MNSYITQFIEDLKALQREPSEPWYRPEEGVELDFSDIERYLLDGQEQQVKVLLELQTEQFPPLHLLTNDQMQAVILAYSELLSSWGICLVIPEGVPAEMAYKIVLSSLDREVFVSQYGLVTLEFCNYVREECPFGVWCHCEEYDEIPTDESEEEDTAI